MEPTTCPNCNHIIEQHFCRQCGEKKFRRINMKDVVSDFFSNFINLEGPILSTIKDLTLRPGKMIHDYLNGKRNKYYKPFQFYILATTVYFVFFYLWGYEMLEMFKDIGASYNTTASSVEMNEFQQKFREFYEKNMQKLNFLQIPVYAWLIWLFFKKKSGHSYTETLVTALYIMAQALVFGIISTFFVSIHPSLPLWIGLLFLLLYLPWCLKQLYQENIVPTIVKSIVIIFLGFLIQGILGGIISIAWILAFS